MKTEQVRDKRTPSRSQSRPSGTRRLGSSPAGLAEMLAHMRGGTRCTYNAKQPTR